MHAFMLNNLTISFYMYPCDEYIQDVPFSIGSNMISVETQCSKEEHVQVAKLLKQIL